MTRLAFAPSAALALLLATGLALVGALPASAHDKIESSTPASGEVVTTDPTTVTLTYSDDLLTLGGDTSAFAVQVTDPDGAFHENGCLTVDGTVASTGVALGGPGSYTVTWQVVSSDGHPTSGRYAFDYQPANTDNSLDGMASPPACGELWSGSARENGSPVTTPEPTMTTMAEAPVTAVPTDATTATATPADSSTPDDGDRTWLVIGVSLAGIALLATVIALTVRRMRHDPFATHEENDPEKP